MREIIDILKRQIQLQQQHIEILQREWHNATLQILRLRMKLNEEAVVDKIMDRFEECEFLDNQEWQI